MKIVFTGGGTAGHFYPNIAIAENFYNLVEAENIVSVELFYFSDTEYDKSALYENKMKFVKIPAGKLRVGGGGIQNFFDMFVTAYGILIAIMKLYSVYPDVVMAKGGYASFPTLFAARLLKIPVVIHESDSTPGRVSQWAGKFAQRVAVSYEDAAKFFNPAKVALTGQPIREELKSPASEGVFDFYKLDPTVPVVLVLGGSQGAEIINNALLDALPTLLPKYQIIHQTGMNNLESVKGQADITMADSKDLLRDRYRAIGFLNVLGMRMAGGSSSVVITRAGSTLFEIASWNTPCIVIPITTSQGDHQRKNAYSYARSGGCVVIEEANLSPAILAQEVEKILDEEPRRLKMIEGAKSFIGANNAGLVIAQELLSIALSHETKE
ncbi:MAG: UDP-N-acetylglucosamine--N-acetylmuramyl-(pentapeptide) pyrophosphoryl-undecaprenol N-acetylglucosamine transferase [Candidatus Pacebacteria bacterium]|nr:UDP-N-acetylglucosamine--N-acetylmuramyl-(pentapeptide) pyrophosphoryl-undecaprenol N-acetylglucosamine transferase [Candidatus Paceibacterota bacterium]MBP9780401.1 UDP-N-acetylglucosamine--N-acetylmuramyl-(pentapeptide) pyrophosphoryl-undecaprenol N-acetylglucosamine transferase [Candidatus Paceibacterota bacterium]MDQ5949511.1 UDP-N-acetylglucosamine--N-acetylmuramyl-(pentapeptide) pyrophosphoryl-undecaprenol [Patescibacteria group bacterium]